MHHNNWLHIISGFLLLAICLYAILNKFIFNKDSIEKLASKADLNMIVKGMTCNHCKETVTEAIYGCDGIRKIKINLESGETFIFGDNIKKQQIFTAINDVGFSIGENS